MGRTTKKVYYSEQVVRVGEWLIEFMCMLYMCVFLCLYYSLQSSTCIDTNRTQWERIRLRWCQKIIIFAWCALCKRSSNHIQSFLFLPANKIGLDIVKQALDRRLFIDLSFSPEDCCAVYEKMFVFKIPDWFFSLAIFGRYERAYLIRQTWSFVWNSYIPIVNIVAAAAMFHFLSRSQQLSINIVRKRGPFQIGNWFCKYQRVSFFHIKSWKGQQQSTRILADL